MITCLPNSGIKWKNRASSVLNVFQKLFYKIIINNITKTIGKSFKILFSYTNIST